jgi:signal transduction histidine kinase
VNLSKLYFHITLLIIGVSLTRTVLAQDIPGQVTLLQQKAESLAQSHPDSTFLLLEKAEELSPKRKLKTVMAVNNWLRAKTMYLQKDYDSTIYYGHQAINLGKETQDHITLSAIHNLLGVLAKRQGQFTKSLSQYDQSMVYAQLAKDSVTWAKALQNMGNVYRQIGQADSALYYFEQSIAIKKLLGDPLSTAKTTLNLGNYYFAVGEFRKAINYYQRTIPLYEEAEYKEGIGRLANNLGATYYKLGFYTLSASHYVKSLKIYDSLQLDDMRINTLINLGVVLKDLGRTIEAKDYYEQALKSEAGIGEITTKANIYRNLGEVLEINNEWPKALESFQNAATIYEQQQRVQDLSESYFGMARSFAGLKKTALAERYFQMSLELKREIRDDLNLGKVLTSLAVFQYENGQYNDALNNYQQGLQLARKYELPQLSRANLLGLSEVYEKLGSPKRALDFRLQYETVKDSLDNLEKARQIAELQEQYESVQKDKRISELALENDLAKTEIEKNEAIAEQQKAKKITYLVATIALFTLALGLFLYYRQRLSLASLKEKEEQAKHQRNIESLLDQQRTKNLEARIAGEEQERQRLAKDLHDHLGSILATVKVNLQGIFDREKSLKENEQVKTVNTLVDKACEDVRGIAHHLHMGISESFGLISALKDLAQSVSSTNGITVQVTATNSTDRFDSNMEVFIYRMVQELLSNALKHSQASLVSIQLTSLEELVSIIVEDNGKGFNKDDALVKHKGIGLKNLISRIEGFDGEITIDSTLGKGTTILVDLPLSTQPELTYDD